MVARGEGGGKDQWGKKWEKEERPTGPNQTTESQLAHHCQLFAHQDLEPWHSFGNTWLGRLSNRHP